MKVVDPFVSLMIIQVESKLFGLEVKMAVILFGICVRNLAVVVENSKKVKNGDEFRQLRLL